MRSFCEHFSSTKFTTDSFPISWCKVGEVTSVAKELALGEGSGVGGGILVKNCKPDAVSSGGPQFWRCSVGVGRRSELERSGTDIETLSAGSVWVKVGDGILASASKVIRSCVVEIGEVVVA